jgi:hypothetical protein
MRKVLVVIVVAAIVLGASVEPSAAVKFVRIHFDSPGADTGTNYRLSREWIHAGDLQRGCAPSSPFKASAPSSKLALDPTGEERYRGLSSGSSEEAER